mmetsp:Transcript_6525/g.11246  ORF Transcript_6525/g.11246 Transcript_6525/m.11246 type:complete len:118 (-) Transcript_6525:313-666(-)
MDLLSASPAARRAVPADPAHRDPRTGRRPLHLAAAYGHVFLARLLIRRGAPLHAEDNAGLTALDLACQEGKMSMVNALIRLGAARGSGQIKGKVNFVSGLPGVLCGSIIQALDKAGM